MLKELSYASESTFYQAGCQWPRKSNYNWSISLYKLEINELLSFSGCLKGSLVIFICESFLLKLDDSFSFIQTDLI